MQCSKTRNQRRIEPHIKVKKFFQTVKIAKNIDHPKEEIYFYFQISFVLLKHELIKPKTQTAKERKRKKHASEAREG